MNWWDSISMLENIVHIGHFFLSNPGYQTILALFGIGDDAMDGMDSVDTMISMMDRFWC